MARPEHVAGGADIVMLGGRILTMDPQSSVAEALAISDGVVAAVGTDAAIRPLIGRTTRVVRLGGRTVLPGINDAHCHALDFGLDRPPFNLDLGFPTVRSIADIAADVGRAAESSPDGAWIVGSGWDPGFLAECVAEPGRLPSRHDLDAVSPRNPCACRTSRTTRPG